MRSFINWLITLIWGKERAKQAGIVIAAVVAAKALPPDPAGLYKDKGPTAQQQLDAALEGTGFNGSVSDGKINITGTYIDMGGQIRSIGVTQDIPDDEVAIADWAKREVARLKELSQKLQ